MNKIIFDKHMKNRGSELIAGSLKLPPEAKKKQSPYYGMISIPEHDWPTSFYNFCANTLISNSQVILAINEIKKECNDVLMRDIYNPNITKTLKVEDFKQIQHSSISQTSYYLRETWVNKIKDIIKTKFALAGQGWFNIAETSRDVYEIGKLK